MVEGGGGVAGLNGYPSVGGIIDELNYGDEPEHVGAEIHTRTATTEFSITRSTTFRTARRYARVRLFGFSPVATA